MQITVITDRQQQLAQIARALLIPRTNAAATQPSRRYLVTSQKNSHSCNWILWPVVFALRNAAASSTVVLCVSRLICSRRGCDSQQTRNKLALCRCTCTSCTCSVTVCVCFCVCLCGPDSENEQQVLCCQLPLPAFSVGGVSESSAEAQRHQ